MTGTPGIAATFTNRLADAADYLHLSGWHQGSPTGHDGRVDLVTAVMQAGPANGDDHLIRMVLIKRRTAEYWNDTEGRTLDDVLAALRTPVTDDELAHVYGPQWVHVVAVVRHITALTPAQCTAIADDPFYSRRQIEDARIRAQVAAGRDHIAHFGASWAAAQGAAAWTEADDHGRRAARVAGSAATSALAVRHLLDHGLEQADYEILTHGWSRHVGPAHPDD